MRLGRRAILLAVAASAVQIPSPPPLLRLPAPGRVVAIGDVHGDIDAFLATLTLAGLANSKGAWSGGDAVLVQTGDVLDRGDDEVAILARLDALGAEARAAGLPVLLPVLQGVWQRAEREERVLVLRALRRVAALVGHAGGHSG